MLIVNITTIDSRLHLCAATLFSLALQSTPIDKIIVWVSSEPYMADKGITTLPAWFPLVNINKNIEFKYTENIGPYRKIIPALNTFSEEDILVYADDDVVYGENWLKYLLDDFNAHAQNYVVASRVRLVTKNIFGRIRGYNDYNVVTQPAVLKDNYIITGVGGCIFSKKHIDSFFYTTRDFLKIAPTTDDVWLSNAFIMSGSQVYTSIKALAELNIIEHDYSALSSINTTFKTRIPGGRIINKIKEKLFGYLGLTTTRNDLAIRAVMEYMAARRANGTIAHPQAKDSPPQAES